MDAHIRKVYVPMTETAFYILLCLRQPNHGYGVVQKTEAMTDGSIRLAPGTMYGSLAKMEKDGLIRFVREEDKRKLYVITPLGEEILAYGAVIFTGEPAYNDLTGGEWLTHGEYAVVHRLCVSEIFVGMGFAKQFMLAAEAMAAERVPSI